MRATLSLSPTAHQAADSGPQDDLRRIDYLPSPAEIASACEAIRSQWTLSEKRRRFVGELTHDAGPDPLWRPPVIDTTQFRLSTARGIDLAS